MDATETVAVPQTTQFPVWDAHSCVPLRPDMDLAVLERHRAAGVRFVSINVGMDMNPVTDILRVLAAFRHQIEDAPDRFLLAETVSDVHRAQSDGRLAVAFDLEGALPLAEQPEMIRLYQRLGVRQMHLAYNRTNSIAGGCHDDDPGLSDLGQRVVAEINRAGILMDCSHTGEVSSLQIMALSAAPVIFSHANPRALVDHGRNITDRQIDACAETGGVIGINGIGLFLGVPGGHVATASDLARHIDHVVQRVGPAHVGIGLDYSYDTGSAADMAGTAVDTAHWWPPGNGYDFDRLTAAPPEVLPPLADALAARGYADADIAGVMGGNFERVAARVWG